jgi:uncharacterized membrane protein
MPPVLSPNGARERSRRPAPTAMSTKAKRPIWLVRVGRAHVRLWISVALRLAAMLVLPASPTTITRMLIGWDIGVMLYLVLVAAMMTGSSVTAIRRNAASQDEGALALLVLSVAAAVASLGAIFAELATIDSTNPSYGLYIALTIATVVLSWTFTHTIFALHYAHEFYGEHARQRCFRFPDDGQPDYWDFVYFAFVIGMTFQVSDVAVTQKSARRLVVAHGVLSFFFTTAIVALTVNIAANVIQR